MTEHSVAVTRPISRPKLAAARKLQVALGLIWLVDAGLQLQPFMFRRSFVTQIITPNEISQPGLIATPIRLIAHLIEPRVAWFNLLAVTIQVVIGVGLLCRPTVKAALLISFGWSLSIWWIGEGLGGLFTGHSSPLTAAPGAALLYVLAGLIAWPRPDSRTGTAAAGGILGEAGARTAWALLWLGFSALWMIPANRTSGSVHDAIANAPSGTHWLTSIQSAVAAATIGRGLAIALVAAVLSAAVGLAVLLGRGAKPALALSASIGLIYFVVGCLDLPSAPIRPAAWFSTPAQTPAAADAWICLVRHRSAGHRHGLTTGKSLSSRTGRSAPIPSDWFRGSPVKTEAHSRGENVPNHPVGVMRFFAKAR
jgi:hypothetical protein